MKKSNTANTTLSSLPSSTTMSAQTLAGSKTTLNSSNKFTRSAASTSSNNKATKIDQEIESILEKAKFYTSVCLGKCFFSITKKKHRDHDLFVIILFAIIGTTAILSVFTFLFLIPFVVDPAISTIIADYDPVPVTCVVIDHIYAEGIKNCTWSSCREGCTSSPNKYV